MVHWKAKINVDDDTDPKFQISREKIIDRIEDVASDKDEGGGRKKSRDTADA